MIIFSVVWMLGCFWLLSKLQPPPPPFHRDPGAPIYYPPGHVWGFFHAGQEIAAMIPDGGYEANPSHKVPPG